MLGKKSIFLGWDWKEHWEIVRWKVTSLRGVCLTTVFKGSNNEQFSIQAADIDFGKAWISVYHFLAHSIRSIN